MKARAATGRERSPITKGPERGLFQSFRRAVAGGRRGGFASRGRNEAPAQVWQDLPLIVVWVALPPTV